MICISLLLCGARCACPDETSISQSTRFVTGRADCYKIHDCVFQGLSATSLNDKSGGAIKLDNDQAKARILDCLFVSCFAEYYGFVNMGGAIYTQAATTILERCCSDDCYSDELGNFLFHDLGETTITQVSVINCRHYESSAKQKGAIYTHAGTVSGTNVNFTANWAVDGSALGSESPTNKIEFTYVTAVGNMGRTVIWHNAAWGKLSFWNFVNNPTIATTVYMAQGSLEVENCLFRGNNNGENQAEFSGSGSCSVSKCIFDGRFLIPGFVTARDNTNDAEIRTIKMCQLNFQNCQARVPCDFTQAFTVSSDFVPSQEFTDSGRFTQTHDFSESNRFTETPGFSQSDEMTQSSVFDQSDRFGASSDFVPTHRFSMSDTLTSITETDQLASASVVADATSWSASDDAQRWTSDDAKERTTATGMKASTVHQTAELSQSKAVIHSDTSTKDAAGKSDSKSLSVGAIVGIVVAIIALIVVAIIVIVVVKRRKPSESDTDMDTNDNETNTSTELEQETVTMTDTQWDPMTEVNPMFADAAEEISEEMFGQNAE